MTTVRAWVAVGVLAVVVAVIIVIRALGRDEGVPFNATTLSYSLEREVNGGSALEERPQPCERGRRFQYRCNVGDTSGSGGGPVYRVTSTGKGCWKAVKVVRETEGRPFPRRASGCVKEVDQPG